jgi:hypothetical protein
VFPGSNPRPAETSTGENRPPNTGPGRPEAPGASPRPAEAPAGHSGSTDADHGPPETSAEERLRWLMARAEQGDATVLPELRAALNANPRAWQESGDLARIAEESWIRLAAGDDLRLRESLARRVAELKRSWPARRRRRSRRCWWSGPPPPSSKSSTGTPGRRGPGGSRRPRPAGSGATRRGPGGATSGCCGR